jgi:hypothetical protein
MVEAIDLKLWLRGHLKLHDPIAEFHECLPTGSKAFSGGHGRTDRQHGDLISMPFIV